MTEKNTRRRTTTANKTQPKAEPKVEQTVEAKEPEKKVEPKAEKKVEKLKNDDMVSIMNNTSGKLVYKSPRTGFKLVMRNYGDDDTIEYSELVAMKNSNPAMISEGHVLILDERAVSELRLQSLYENMFDYNGLQEFFKLPPKEIEAKLEKMPKTMCETVASVARQKYRDESLYDSRIIKAIENSLGVKIAD